MESKTLLKEVEHIKHRVTDLEACMRVLVKMGQNDALTAEIKHLFAGKRTTQLVFRAVDAIRNGLQIRQHLQQQGDTVSAPTISRALRTLETAGLIEQVDVVGSGRIFKHSYMADLLRVADLVKGLDTG